MPFGDAGSTGDVRDRRGDAVFGELLLGRGEQQLTVASRVDAQLAGAGGTGPGYQCDQSVMFVYRPPDNMTGRSFLREAASTISGGHMDLHGATALVTGANRGIGHHFAVELLERGAKVYATARRPELVDIPGAEVLRLDITDQSSVDAAAAVAGDVDLLVNNAASTAGGNLVTGDLDAIRGVMDSNYYGTPRDDPRLRADPRLATEAGRSSTSSRRPRGTPSTATPPTPPPNRRHGA